MGGLLDNLGALVVQHPAWSQWIIAAGTLLQGEIAVLVCVFLVVNHSLTWTEFIVPSLGALIFGDISLYVIGRLLRNTRIGWRFYKKHKNNRRTQLYLYYVRENVQKLLIASKFLFGANIISILAISWSKVKFPKFLKSQLTGALLWFFLMTGVAYSFASGLTLLKSEKIFQQIEIGIAVVILIIFGGEYFLRKFIRKMFGFGKEETEKMGTLPEKLEGEPDDL